VFHVLRSGPLLFVLLLSLSGWTPAAAQAAKPKPKPTPTPAPTATPEAKKPKDAPKRVFTNDDLEAFREKPSAVQDLSAVGMPPPPIEPVSGSEPAQDAPPPEDARTEQQRRIEEAEAEVKALDDQANQLLWLYLQSSDTNEILRLKAEQQEVLDRLKQTKADLARLKGEAGSDAPAPTPTRQPG
jgi:hypothetical protein